MKVTIDSTLLIAGTTEQINMIAADNTYQNPEYQNAINMNRSTYNIDRTIKTYTKHDDCIEVPRGYYHLLPEHELIDNRATIKSNFQALDGVILRGYQVKAVDNAMQMLCCRLG